MFCRRIVSSCRSIYKNMVISSNPGCYQTVVHLSSTPEESQLARFKQRESETDTQKRARLLYQSRKRGMLENDLLLSTFAGKYLKTFDAHQLDLYDRLINLPSNDWDIYYWATGIENTPPEFENEVMEMLKKHVSNENKETRYRQPDL